MLQNEKIKIPTSREILRGLPTVRAEWRHKKPLEKFCYLYGIGKMALSKTRVPIFDDDRSINWFSYFAFVYVGGGLVLLVFSAIYWVIQGNPTKFLPSTVLILFGCVTCSVIMNMVNEKRHILHSLVQFGGRYIYFDEHDDPVYQQICSEHMDLSMKQFLIKMALMIIGYNAAIFGPIYAYISQGTKTTTFDLTFTENGSNAEFAFNSLLQVIGATHGGLMYIGVEVMVQILQNVITISPKLIAHKLKRLTTDYEEKRISEQQLRTAFKEIEKQSIDTDNFVSATSDILYGRCLLIPPIFTYSIAMAIFSQYMLGFVAGYGLAFMSWSQLFYMCEMGESIEDNGFVEMLYDSDWYVLPTDLQKDIMHLIDRKQNAIGLSIGPFGTNINRELFKIITNKIYTFVMLLLSLTE